MKYRVTSTSTDYPVSLEQARSQCRIVAWGDPASHPDDDALLAMVGSAVAWCEEYLRRSLVEKTIEIYFDAFAQKMELPFVPIKSVSSIKYLNTDGVLTTLATDVYRLKQYDDSAKINLIMGKSYPSDVSSEESAVTVTIVTGYTDVPEPILSAIKLIVGNLYENRQEDVLGSTRISFNSLPMGVASLLQPYRLGLGL